MKKRTRRQLDAHWMIWYLSGTVAILERVWRAFDIDTGYAQGALRRILRELKRELRR